MIIHGWKLGVGSDTQCGSPVNPRADVYAIAWSEHEDTVGYRVDCKECLKSKYLRREQLSLA